MRVLSIDTSTMISACAVMEGGVIIGDVNINQEKSHSESLLPMIDWMLVSLNLTIEDIDLIVVADGPGSFTGLRIGMTVAKTLAQVLKIPIVSVSTLKAMANSIISDGYVVPILDARGKRVYYAVYQRAGKELVPIESEDLTEFPELFKRIESYSGTKTFLGEAVNLYRAELESVGDIIIGNPGLNNCIARNLCDLGLQKYLTQGAEVLYDLKPNYVRLSQAQRELEKRNQDEGCV